jgi:hypothetical protein
MVATLGCRMPMWIEEERVLSHVDRTLSYPLSHVDRGGKGRRMFGDAAKCLCFEFILNPKP